MASSIHHRLFIHTVLLAVVPLLIVAFVVTWLSFTVHKRQALNLEREVAEQAALRLKEHFQHMRNLLAMVDKTSGISSLPQGEQETILRHLLQFENRPFLSLTLLDPDGKVTANISQNPGTSRDDRDWVNESAFLLPLHDGVAHYGLVHSNPDGLQLMDIALPLHDPYSDQVSGVIVAQANVSNIWQLVETMDLGEGESMFVLDSGGTLMAWKPASSDPVKETSMDPLLAWPSDSGIRLGHEGVWVIAARSTIEVGGNSFTVVAERRLASSLGLAVTTLRTIMALLLLSFVAALGVGYMSIRRIARPVRELAEAARALRAGEPFTKPPVPGSVDDQDEIGELVQAFNSMADQLQQTLTGLREKVNELTLTQERLQESEQQYRDIYERASEGIFLIDMGGYIQDANPQALSMLELSMDELVGRTAGEIIHPDDLAELPVEVVLDRVHKGETMRTERRYRRKSGDYIICEMSIKLIADDLVQVMFRDMSERKRIEDELVRAKNAAEEANKAKGIFLATMSHEIRTPLSNVIGMAELTLESDLSEELRENLEMILDSAVSLLDIINDILDLAKIEARGISLAHVDFNLVRAMERTLRNFTTQAARKNDTLHMEIAPDVPEVLNGDPGRLAQVLRNMVHNAIKFTENGTITISVTRTSFEEFSADGINPTDAGARIYAEAVAAFVDDLMTACPVPEKPQRYVLPEPLFPETDDNGRIIAYEDPQVKRSGNWKPGQESPIGPFRHLLVSDEPGAALTLKFKGSEIGLIDVVDKDGADYAYSVDGAAFQKLPVPRDVTSPTMRPVSLAKGLDRNAEHELTLKVASEGTARLGGFLLNGNVENAFAGMSSLERIDAIYAAMDPIVYEPPEDRFANIPKTMDKLRGGGELRVVLLGDSIMGNTSSSSFEQLLMRDYPKCKITKIASLRGSTGCNSTIRTTIALSNTFSSISRISS